MNVDIQPCPACRAAALQELWLSVGEQLPEEDEEMAAELRKIGEWHLASVR